MLRDFEKIINSDFLNKHISLTGQQENRITQSRVATTGKPENRIHIKAYCDTDKQVWDNFVLNSENSSFFHLIGWKDVVKQSFGHKAHFMMSVQENQITGILPLFEIKSRLFGHALVSVPFGAYGGMCSMNREAESALYRSTETLGKLMSVDYVEMRNQIDSKNVRNVHPEASGQDVQNVRTNEVVEQAEQSNNSNWLTKDLYVTFQRGIYPDIESNFKAVPRKQRRMIRQGIKAGLLSKIGRKEHLKDFYNIYARNLRNLGTPVFPLKYFENIMEIFPETFILSVWKDNVMVAGVMTFIFKDRLMPYYGGSLKKYLLYAVNDFMYWELMRYGCEKGYKIFDFGRSKKGTGSYDFKCHWGFEPKELPYTYYLVTKKDMPNISPANPRYTAMISVWKRLPLSLTKWLGSKIVRNIP